MLLSGVLCANREKAPRRVLTPVWRGLSRVYRPGPEGVGADPVGAVVEAVVVIKMFDGAVLSSFSTIPSLLSCSQM